MATITCKVVAENVWFSQESRFLAAGDTVEFPAEVKDFEGKLVPFKVGASFEVVKADSRKKKPAEDDLV